MKNVLKISIMAILFLILLVSNTAYASTPSCSGITSDAENFISKGQEEYDKSKIESDDITTQVVPFVQMLTAAGILIIGACLVVLGIQWVLARPSPEAQAKLKGKLIALAVAAAVMFGSFSIWSILVNILSSI